MRKPLGRRRWECPLRRHSRPDRLAGGVDEGVAVEIRPVTRDARERQPDGADVQDGGAFRSSRHGGTGADCRRSVRSEQSVRVRARHAVKPFLVGRATVG